MKGSVSVLVALISTLSAVGQNYDLPKRCGFLSRDLAELKDYYERSNKHFGVQPNETVASVGASAGTIEIQISTFVNGVHWTIQDIDTTCLTDFYLQNVIHYYERLVGEKTDDTFEIVIGDFNKTNLPRDTYDRIILSNVIHELTEREKILKDVRGALKQNGVVAVMEKMAKKRGQSHADCKQPMTFEPDFLKEMELWGFELVSKIRPYEKFPLVYYIFKRA